MAGGHLKIARYKILATGRVKRVGFRHHVSKLARKYHLGGYAANGSEGVYIEIEGTGDNLDLFINSLRTNPPLFSKIVSFQVNETSLRGEKEFKILSDLPHPLS